MKPKTWKILLLVGLVVGAILLTRQIAKANTDAYDGTDGGNAGGVDDSQKVLGSATSAAFASDVKLYANADNLRIRKTAGLTGEILQSVDAGVFIGTTTGAETSADSLTWVTVTLTDGTRGYVAKNYTYITV